MVVMVYTHIIWGRPGNFGLGDDDCRNGDEWWRVRSKVQTTMLKPMVVREYLGEMDEVTLTFMDRCVALL